MVGDDQRLDRLASIRRQAISTDSDCLTPPCSEWRGYRAEPVDLDVAGYWGFSYSTASLPMSTESQLREKLRKIDALFAGAGTAGERLAAEAALEHVRERLTELGRKDPSIEMQFSMPDQWSRYLFLALCRRYGMKPHR
jgi:hypothetical protein